MFFHGRGSIFHTGATASIRGTKGEVACTLAKGWASGSAMLSMIDGLWKPVILSQQSNKCLLSSMTPAQMLGFFGRFAAERAAQPEISFAEMASTQSRSFRTR
jgi:hypothetical protein